jgi:hypothetical protein
LSGPCWQETCDGIVLSESADLYAASHVPPGEETDAAVTEFVDFNHVELNDFEEEIWEYLGPFLDSRRGLVAYWNFEEMEGDIVYDQAGNGHDGGISGATWAVGHDGSGCLEFDGSGDCVGMNGGSWLTIPKGTMEAWIKVPLGAGGGRILSTETGGYVNGFHLGYAWDSGFNGALIAGIHSTEGGDHFAQAYIEPISQDEWHYVACTWDGDTNYIMVYVDGETNSMVSPHPGIEYTGEDFTIGCWENGPSQGGWFEGWIDEVRVYNRPLSLAELDRHYQGFLTSVEGN